MAAQGSGEDRVPSILFGRARPEDPPIAPDEPPFFPDLKLDELVAALVAGREEFQLEELYRSPLRDVEAVRYRHEVVRELDDPSLVEVLEAFGEGMRSMRLHLDRMARVHHPYEKERWLLQAASTYVEAVRALVDGLEGLTLRSRGFLAVRGYLADRVRSDGFTTVEARAHEALDALAGVRYQVQIRGTHVTVSGFEGSSDYSADVERVFAKFQQGAVKDYRLAFYQTVDMNHVEARIMELVQRLHPGPFELLHAFAREHLAFSDPEVVAFDREIRFYLAYLSLIRPLETAGVPFCLPRVSSRSKDAEVIDAFDLTLALKLVAEGRPIIPNGFHLSGPERVMVVTGPNQGGKTTFARMVGQLHHLASLGLPVPGRAARLFLPDAIFAHFERQEDIETLRGKLEDELVRVAEIFERATGDSLVIMNESFTSTTLSDALFLGREVMARIVRTGMLCVYVTFVEELSALGPSIVSLVGAVDPSDPSVRTFRIERRPADGLAFATAIAEKHGLTFASVRERVAT